jgi:hypothetical protein
MAGKQERNSNHHFFEEEYGGLSFGRTCIGV